VHNRHNNFESSTLYLSLKTDEIWVQNVNSLFMFYPRADTITKLDYNTMLKVMLLIVWIHSGAPSKIYLSVQKSSMNFGFYLMQVSNIIK